MERRAKRRGVGVTEDAWTAALATIGITPPDADAVTTTELAARWNCGERTALRRVRKLVQAGLAVHTSKRLERHAVGQGPLTVSAYRLVEGAAHVDL